ncbi:MAG: folate-binding protein YgfZ [Halioglobus sp.]
MTTHYCLLEQDGLLHIVGPDSLKFLQGQTTCDTEAVALDRSVQGAYCTPQGRVVCDFLLTELGSDHFALRMRRAIMENSAAVFGKYIIFSKAELDAKRSDWEIIAVWGDDAAARLSSITGQSFNGQLSAVATDGRIAVQGNEAGTAFECFVEASYKAAFLEALASELDAGQEADWQAQQVRSGLARIEEATVEEFVPQIINYDITEHINFKKGCYTGQEVVARLHYRGTPKRRTYIAELDASPGDLPAPGTAVYADAKEQSIGTIVNCAAGEKGAVALVAVTLDAAKQPLRYGSNTGNTFQVVAPPYPLEKDA